MRNTIKNGRGTWLLQEAFYFNFLALQTARRPVSMAGKVPGDDGLLHAMKILQAMMKTMRKEGGEGAVQTFKQRFLRVCLRLCGKGLAALGNKLVMLLHLDFEPPERPSSPFNLK